MTDYESPIQPGKNIVIGQAAILWGEGFQHADKGRIEGGWILPGCVRTTNGEHAARVCRDLNASIRATTRLQPIIKALPSDESIGEEIARRLREVR